MAQYEMNLRDYWLIVRRRRMIIIASTVLVALLSFGFVRQKVPVYQATTAVKFEQSTQLSGLLVEVLSYSSADSIETQVTIIKSYPILEDVAKRLGYLKETPTGAAATCSRLTRAATSATGARSTPSTPSSEWPACRTPVSSRSRRPRRSRARRKTSRTPPPSRIATTTNPCGTRASARRGDSSRAS